MRLYHNITRFQYRRFFPKGSWRYRKMLWASSLKPGDVISACTGFNVRIAKIEPVRVLMSDWHGKGYRGRPTGWYTTDHDVIDTNGGFHGISSCCSKPDSVARIEAYWATPTEEYLIQQETLGWDVSRTRKLQQVLRANGRICDDDGLDLGIGR